MLSFMSRSHYFLFFAVFLLHNWFSVKLFLFCRICKELGFCTQEIDGNCINKEDFLKIMECFLRCLEDYSTDRRGDVGAWCASFLFYFDRSHNLVADLFIFYIYFCVHCSQKIREIISAPLRHVRNTRSLTKKNTTSSARHFTEFFNCRSGP